MLVTTWPALIRSNPKGAAKMLLAAVKESGSVLGASKRLHIGRKSLYRYFDELERQGIPIRQQVDKARGLRRKAH